MTEIFVLGFDPVFIDILVTPLTPESTPLSSFPKIGEHIANTKISMVPGGNGLNVARVLSLLTPQVLFFSNFNPFFAELLRTNTEYLQYYSTKSLTPNITVALQFSTGEVQMNAVSSFFGPEDLSFTSLLYLCLSNVVPFSNLGLNTKGPSLFDFLCSFFNNLKDFLYTISHDSDRETNFDKLVNFIRLQESTFPLSFVDPEPTLSDFSKLLSFTPNLDHKVFYFDSSTLQSFTKWNWLQEFLSQEFKDLPGHKIITINEYEFESLKSHNIDLNLFLTGTQTFMVVHESTKVTIYQKNLKNVTVLPVPVLEADRIVTSVGAGDSFTAGLLYDYVQSFDIFSACNHAITIAQRYLTNTL